MKNNKLQLSDILQNTFTITNLKILVITSFLVLLTGCTGMQSGSESWEGISGTTLKVTIYEFFLFEESASADDIKNQILEKLNQRAALLIASHISMNLTRDKVSSSSDSIFNDSINEVIKSGKLIDYSCTENNYCSANSQYNISNLLETLESINKQQ